jgi:energy-coupling factor transport system permease protein
MSAAVDPDELLKALRRISYRSALTASLATRLVPVLARDAGQMGEAARCRPHPPGRLAVVRSALANSLERAVEVAAALEVRGYALAGRPARRRRPLSRHDLRVGGAALTIFALAIGGAAAGVGHMEAYPTLDVAAGPAELALASALVVLGGAPLVGRAARLGVARA